MSHLSDVRADLAQLGTLQPALNGARGGRVVRVGQLSFDDGGGDLGGGGGVVSRSRIRQTGSGVGCVWVVRGLCVGRPRTLRAALMISLMRGTPRVTFIDATPAK